MAEEKKKLSAKEVVADIRAGATDEFLMKKYGINDRGLQTLFQKLITAKAITQVDLDGRTPGNAVPSRPKPSTTGVEGQTITSPNERSRVSPEGAATGNIEAGRRNSSAQFPMILSRFPQPNVPSEFSRLFSQITVEEQIEPGIYRYVGVSPENPVVEVIGNDQEIIVARLEWGKPVPSDMGDRLVDFILGFLMSFCQRLSADDYAAEIHGILDMANDPDNEGYFDKVVGDKRIGLTLENTSCRVTIDDADSSQGQVSAEDPELAHKMSLLDNALRAGVITEAEFKVKKAEMEREIAKAREVDPEEVKFQEYLDKLIPLGEALDAGFLTKEEYDTKRKDLIAKFDENLPQYPAMLKSFPQPRLSEFSKFFKEIRLEEPLHPGIYKYVAVAKWDLWLTFFGNDHEIKAARLSWSVPIPFFKESDLLQTLSAYLWFFIPGLNGDGMTELIRWCQNHICKGGKISYSADQTVLNKYVAITGSYAKSHLTIQDQDFYDIWGDLEL